MLWRLGVTLNPRYWRASITNLWFRQGSISRWGVAISLMLQCLSKLAHSQTALLFVTCCQQKGGITAITI